MIRLTCPVCQSRLNAKDELAGQTRKCPKCGKPLVIPKSVETWDAYTDELIALEEPDPEQHVVGAVEEKLPHIPAPERLDRQNRYLICDREKVIATWQNDSRGWMLRISQGQISAIRNPEKLPAQGKYEFVELALGVTDEGLRLQGLHCYRLADRWALTTLDQGDDRIVGRIAGPGTLNKEQKMAVRKYLMEAFMREVWQESHETLDYLANRDFHSPGTPYRQPTRKAE